MGIGFCQPNQTHKQVYWKQVHLGSYQLRHQVGGSKGIAHKYNSCDNKFHLQIHSHTVWMSSYFGKWLGHSLYQQCHWNPYKPFFVTTSTSTTYYLQGNGQAKSIDKIIGSLHPKLVNENRTNWDEHLHTIMYFYCTTFKVTTGHTILANLWPLPFDANKIPATHEQFTSRSKLLSNPYFDQSYGKIGALGWNPPRNNILDMYKAMGHNVMGLTKPQIFKKFYGGHNSLVSKGQKWTHWKVQKLVVWSVYKTILSPQ